MVGTSRQLRMLADCAPVVPASADAAAIIAQQATLPQRPDSDVLNEAIPLFFIGRNEDGFWVARDAGGQFGGMFLCKESALRFANRNSQPGGCATMLLSERFELDIENRGNPVASRLATAKQIVLQLAERGTPWAVRFMKRAHPAALLLGFFAMAFTATIVLRLAVWLAAMAIKAIF